MRGIVNILPWIVSFLMALGIASMQAIGGGGRPMFPLMVCYLPILAAGLLSIPVILVARSNRAPDRICLGAAVVFGAYLLGRTCVGGDQGLRDFELLRLGSCVLVYLITVAGVTAKGPRLFFLGILLATAFLQACVEIYQFYCDRAWSPLLEWLPFLKNYYPETAGTYANKNHLAWLLGDGALFAVSLACWGRLRWVTRGLLLYLFFFLGFGVCISLSRGGVVALLTGLLVFAVVSVILLLLGRDRGRLLAGILAGMTVAAVSAGAFAFFSSNPVLGLRMKAIWMDVYREDLWRGAIHDLGNAPFFGMGAGSFQWCARLMMPAESLLAHNDYIQLLSEYGLVGILFLILFLSVHLRAGFSALFRNRRQDSRIGSLGDSKAIHLGALAVVSAQMLHSVLDFNMHLASNALIAAFCLGLLCSGHSVRSWSGAALLGFRWLLALWVAGFVVFLGALLQKSWNGERQLFSLEELVGRLPGSVTRKELAEASAAAASLLEKEPSARLAALRVNLFRKQCALGAGEFFRESDESLLFQRQLAHTATLDRGDWYVHHELAHVMSRLGDEEGARREFLEAMVRLPLYAIVYQEYASILAGLGSPREALHYDRIASRFKDSGPRSPKIKEGSYVVDGVLMGDKSLISNEE